MKNKLVILLGVVIVITSSFTFISHSVTENNLKTQVVKADEVAKGLLEALQVGAKNSAEKASKVDGFYKNAEIFIPFPPEAINIKKTLEKAGLKKQVTEFELSVNRAAEEASKKALPILLDAIKGISFTDAMSILKGSNDAATTYLKGKTSEKLTVTFKPIVKDAISKVQVTKYWGNVASSYNKLSKLSGGKAVNPDLEAYITGKAIDGLFILIAKEEKQIRENPAARVTDLLKKIFK
ncbi:MAG: DUF4197 domain-containing protein [Tenuifilaceae bacterium]